MSQHMTNATPLPDWIDPTQLDADRCVTTDLPCGQCKYNLHTRPILSTCPECGWPVQESARRTDLGWADPIWVGRLATGARCLWIAHVGTLVTCGLTLLGRILPTALALALLGLIGTTVLATRGAFGLTTIEPLVGRTTAHVALRWTARYATLGATVATVCLSATVPIIAPARNNLPITMVFLATILLGLIATPLAMFRQLARLLRRGSPDELSRTADTLGIVLPVLGVFVFSQSLVSLLLSVPVMHSLAGVRIAAMLLTGLGYSICGLVSWWVCLRSDRLFREELAIARENAVRRRPIPTRPADV